MSAHVPNVPPEQAEPLLIPDADILFEDFLDQAHLLLAVSGGPDSVALAQLAVFAAKKRRFRLSVATVDHGLRKGSDNEALTVARLAASFSVSHATLLWRGIKPATRIQEAARAARYQLLVEHAQAIGAAYLVTAHTLEDQAETILFRLSRGSGVSGLIGMRREILRDGITHLRPLLAISKARLIATCKVNGLSFVEDPSNMDPKFARPRWRKLMPQLEKEGLTPERLAQLSRRVERVEQALEIQVDRIFAGASCKNNGLKLYNAEKIAAEPFEIVLRVLQKIIREASPENWLDPMPMRLNRLERLTTSFLQDRHPGKIWRRSLAGLVIEVDRQGMLHVWPENRWIGDHLPQK